MEANGCYNDLFEKHNRYRLPQSFNDSETHLSGF